MPDYLELGQQVREFLTGLLASQELNARSVTELTAVTTSTASSFAVWGPRVETQGIPDLYAPQQIEPFTATPAGIDNLALSSVDTFFVPGRGEFTVNFDGYFRVARAQPTTNDWATADVFVNMVDLRVSGEHPTLGPVKVSLNPDVVSSGQVIAPGAATQAAACRIGTAAVFDLPQVGLKLFNKEPILLKNDGIRSVPPVEDPNGVAHIFNLPLYKVDEPNGTPAAYLKSLRYTVGNYITEAQAQELRR